MPLSHSTRETIENWVGDFCHSDRLREAHPAVREHAAAMLVEFLAHAVEASGARMDEENPQPGDVEEPDLKAALLGRVARLNLPEAARPHVPQLCALFLTGLEEEGRLGGGRMLGVFILALRGPFERAAAGKGETYTRPGSKIGRNDPCPCGSGRKYKTCCMDR